MIEQQQEQQQYKKSTKSDQTSYFYVFRILLALLFSEPKRTSDGFPVTKN